MRAVFTVLLFLSLAFFHFAVPALAGPEPDNSLAESLDLPKQSAQAGVADLLWQAGYRYPGGQFYVLTHFPQGLSTEVDAAVARFAKEQFDETCSSLLSMAADSAEEAQAAISGALVKNGKMPPAEETSLNVPHFSVYSYQVLRPSPRFASVYFMGNEYTGGAHGNRFHVVLSYNLASGNKLEIDELFADKAAGLPKLINRIADSVQALKSSDADPVDRDPAAIDANMDRIALTPEGIRVIYAPYEMGSYAEGEFIVDIPKAELATMGIKPDFWNARDAK